MAKIRRTMKDERKRTIKVKKQAQNNAKAIYIQQMI